MFDWQMKEIVHRELEMKFETDGWRVEVYGYYDCNPPRANISFWLKNLPLEVVDGVTVDHLQQGIYDRPVVMWSQIPFKTERELMQIAERNVHRFLASMTLLPGRSNEPSDETWRNLMKRVGTGDQG